MKKIKKLLPVLLGVMVLMFGTLTVCASTVIDYGLSLDSMNDVVTKAFDEKKYSHPVFSFTEYCYYKVDDENIVIYATLNHLYKQNYNSNSFALISENGGGVYMINYNFVTKTYTGTTNSGSVMIPYSKITDMGSSANIIDRQTGDVFFTRTLQVPVAVQAEKLPELVQGQTKVILTTAVACLALLVISLASLRKLPLFLNR